MKIARIVFMVIACMAQTACVTPQETIPPETRAELIRLGRIIINESEEEEIRSRARIRYCDIVRESMEKYGKKSVDWQTVIDSFVEEGREPANLTLRDDWLYYFFRLKDGTFATITIYAGGWIYWYVEKAYPGGAIQ